VNAGEIYLVFTEPLERLGLDYLVTGSVASSSYGEPRFTHDIDLILALPEASVDRLWEAFPLEDFYCPPPEAIRQEVERESGGHFNLVHHESGFRADIYVAPEDDLTSWAFSNPQAVEVLPGRAIRLAPPEFVILGKLQFYTEGGGERHVRDIRAMLELGEDGIDMGFLENKVRALGVEEAWRITKAESEGGE